MIKIRSGGFGRRIFLYAAERLIHVSYSLTKRVNQRILYMLVKILTIFFEVNIILEGYYGKIE